jgi:hypothetical protein
MHPDCRPLLRHRLTISKTVRLFRVDRKDRPPMFQEGLYHRAARTSMATANPVYLPCAKSFIDAVKSVFALPLCSILCCRTTRPSQSEMHTW